MASLSWGQGEDVRIIKRRFKMANRAVRHPARSRRREARPLGRAGLLAIAAGCALLVWWLESNR